MRERPNKMSKTAYSCSWKDLKRTTTSCRWMRWQQTRRASLPTKTRECCGHSNSGLFSFVPLYRGCGILVPPSNGLSMIWLYHYSLDFYSYSLDTTNEAKFLFFLSPSISLCLIISFLFCFSLSVPLSDLYHYNIRYCKPCWSSIYSNCVLCFCFRDKYFIYL